MITCLDVGYYPDKTLAAALVVGDWRDAIPLRERVEVLPPAAPYEPGEFYKRELPPLLHILGVLGLPDIVVVDSFVWLGPDHPGLGARLHEALGKRCPVVGIAKNPFKGCPGIEASRHGTRPLWVTAAGMDPTSAADRVVYMHGPYRIPTLLKRVDDLSRGAPPRWSIDDVPSVEG